MRPRGLVRKLEKVTATQACSGLSIGLHFFFFFAKSKDMGLALQIRFGLFLLCFKGDGQSMWPVAECSPEQTQERARREASLWRCSWSCL